MSQNVAPYPLAMSPQEAEQHRHECEARYWLKETGGDYVKEQGLLKRITEKRGAAAATRLIDEMRKQQQLQQQTKTTGRKV